MRNHGGEELPMPPRRPLKGSNDGTLDIQSAVDFMDEATEQVFHLSKELAVFSANAKALVDGPLTLECVITLLQASIKKKRNGRPQPEDLIRAVLEGAANLGGKYLKPVAKK